MSDQTDGPATFLRACLDEDEEWARARLEAIGWRGGQKPVTGMELPGDPDFVLAEVAAKRRILDAHPHIETSGGIIRPLPGVGCMTCHEAPTGVAALGLCDTILALVSPYAGRPGWNDAWSAPHPTDRRTG